MPRGYRCIIVAVVGWIILAAAPAPNNGAGNKQPGAADKRNNTLGSIASSLKEANKPKLEATNCSEGSDDRKSDLCAQWQAADAAESSANATWWTVYLDGIGVALGIVTMGAAIAAAYFAKRAADETQRSAKAAEDALAQAKHEARAWLSITVEPEKIVGSDHGVQFYFRITIKNVGGMVAQNMQFHFQIFDARAGDRKIRRQIASWEKNRRIAESVVQPGESLSRSLWSAQAKRNFVWDDSTTDRIFHPGLNVYVMYTVAGDDTPRHSSRNFTFAQRNVTTKGKSVSSLLALYAAPNPIENFISERRLPIDQEEAALEPFGSSAT